MNVSVSLPMAFSAEAHRTEGQFRRLKSTLNKLKSRKFKFVTRRTTVSSEGQDSILDNGDGDDDDDDDDDNNNNNNNNNKRCTHHS
jgi:hypothetical protein